MNAWVKTNFRLRLNIELITLALFLNVQSSFSNSGTNFVTNTNDLGEGSLRQAILDANALGGATILFSNVSGVITLTFALPEISGKTTIKGPGKGLLTVSGNSSNRIFSFSANSTSTVSRLSIANGYSPEGGGGIVNLGTLTMNSCLLTNNNSPNGGAFLNRGDLKIYDCNFNRNISKGYDAACGFWDSATPGRGAGISSDDGSIILERCSFLNNQSYGGNSTICFGQPGGAGSPGFGGALFVKNCITTLINCTLTNNYASGSFPGSSGGGIFGENSQLSAFDCSFVGNSSGYSGGAISANGGSLTLSSCSFIRNRLAGTDSGGRYEATGGGHSRGGAIFSQNQDVFISTSLIASNSAEAGSGSCITYPDGTIDVTSPGDAEGGGLVILGGNATIVNSTISGNRIVGGRGAVCCQFGQAYHGDSRGAGLYLTNGSVFINSCTISSNVATLKTNGISSGGGLYLQGTITLKNSLISYNSAEDGIDLKGTFITGGNNLLSRTNGALGYGELDLTNLNPLLGALQDNGGPTLTHALLSGSPAMDAGSNRDSPLVFDQRGQARTVDNPAVVNRLNSDGVDIGALEADHRLTISQAEASGSNFMFRFATFSGKTYGIEYYDGSWNQPVRLPNTIRGTGGSVLFTIKNGISNRFYRAFQR